MAFVTSFLPRGGQLDRNAPTARRTLSLRAAMDSSSVAPKITLFDTGDDGTRKVMIEFTKVEPKEAMAVEVTANSALAATLAGRKGPAVLEGSKPAPPAGVSPADYYFTKETRNLAPAISMTYDSSISVSMDEVNPVVGGIAANSVEKQSVAFWKAKTYKWSAPAAPSGNLAADITPAIGAEPISTEKFEAYFPSKIRNIAPEISMKGPAFPGDSTAYLSVGKSYVGLNTEAAGQMSVSQGWNDTKISASAVVEKYFGESMGAAPAITIDEKAQKVAFEFVPVGAADESTLDAVREAALTS